MKSAIYIRTSTDEQTPEIQLEGIKTLKPGKDAILFREQLSAYKDNVERPQLAKLLQLIRTRQIKAVYVWSLDRIYRNRKRLIEFLALCKNYQVSVYSYNQKWLTEVQKITPPWNEVVYDLMLQVIGWMAEDESRTRSKRVSMAIRKSTKGTYSHKGNKWGRKAIPTYKRRVIIAYHKRGLSIREIADIVTVYDKNKNERPISKSAVHKIITDFEAKKSS